MTSTTATPDTLTALSTEAIVKGWEAAKADAAAADKVKKAADKLRGVYAGEADTRLHDGDTVTIDGNRRVQWDVSEYEVEKAGEVLKALIPFLNAEQLDVLARLKAAPQNRTPVRKLAFKAFKD